MNILVTGTNGFIGSNMKAHLLSIGHTVKTYEWGDPLPDVRDMDWVIHMGAISSTTERNVERIMHQNFDSSVSLLEQCIENKVNFQYSSSASVYGLRTDFREDSPVDPRTPYAWSKYLFERHVNQLVETTDLGIRVQGFRYFNVYGPGEDHKGNQASPHHKFAKQFRETGKIVLFENSDKYLRDFVPVEQVCNAHVSFFDVQESGVWNVGTGSTKSFEDVAVSVAGSRENLEYITMPDILRDSYQEYTCADMTKTKNSLGLSTE